VISDIEIAKVERELKLLRNKLANCESQNRLLSECVVAMQRQRTTRARSKAAARQRRYYLNNGKEKRRLRRQRQEALAAKTIPFPVTSEAAADLVSLLVLPAR
jgi:hypothetical protein